MEKDKVIALASEWLRDGAAMMNRGVDVVSLADTLARLLLDTWPGPTRQIRITGEARAAETARAFVTESKWFTCMPCPDDEYVFTIKDEQA